jgi:DNA-binding CsgD family transcriptional regulator
LGEALEHAGTNARLASEVEAALAELCANGGRHAAAVAHGRAAIQHAERSGDRGLLATALASHGVMAFFHGDGVQMELMERARELEPYASGTSYGMPTTSLGLQLFWSDQPDAARPLLEASLRRAEERGEDTDHAGLLFHLAHLEWEAGNTETAERLTRRVESSMAFVGDAQLDSYLAWLAAYRAARAGELATANTAAHRAATLAAEIGDQFIASFATAILAAVDLWSGRPEGAHERIAPVREAYASGGFIGALTVPFWSCDAEALTALGRTRDAQAVIDALSKRAGQADNPHAAAIAHRCRGALLAAEGDISAGIGELDLALAAHHRRPLPLDVGRTWLEKGSLERRARRKSAAKHSLEQALRRLEPLGASLWAARARDELGRIGLRRTPARAGLTPAEQRVAELAASGLTTRQIADTLYMSTRTVETHLTRIYREFGVSSRAQIALALRTAEAADAAADPAAADGRV